MEALAVLLVIVIVVSLWIANQPQKRPVSIEVDVHINVQPIVYVRPQVPQGVGVGRTFDGEVVMSSLQATPRIPVSPQKSIDTWV